MANDLGVYTRWSFREVEKRLSCVLLSIGASRETINTIVASFISQLGEWEWNGSGSPTEASKYLTLGIIFPMGECLQGSKARPKVFLSFSGRYPRRFEVEIPPS